MTGFLTGNTDLTYQIIRICKIFNIKLFLPNLVSLKSEFETKNLKKRRPTTKQSTTTPAPVTTKILTTKQNTTKLTPKPTKPIVAKAPKRKVAVIPDVPLPGNKKWRGPGPKAGKYPKSCHDIFVKHAEKCNKPTQGFYAIQVFIKIYK